MTARTEPGAWVGSGRRGDLSRGPGPDLDLPGLHVLGELGRGATTVVYRVRRGAADYAVKVFQHSAGDGRSTEQALVGFRREAAMMASIDHPGLPRIHDVGQVHGRPYLVMDLVTGRSLADLLVDGVLPPPTATHLALDVTAALVEVHRRGLVHRDVKPQNIMVTGNGHASLIDFGLAAWEGGHPGTTVAGTLVYAPPEQSGMLKRPVDGRSDLYSLGVVLFECLAGRPPFPADDPGELLRMHAAAAAPDLRSLATAVPPALGAMVAMLLAKDPDDRYQSGEDLASDLRRLVADPAAVFAPGRPGRAPHRRQEHPLCGRDRERARLVSRWEQARQRRGGVCVIRGPGGSGKSRLAAELAALVQDQGALVLSGRSPEDEAVPLAPLRSAVEEAVRTLADLPEPERVHWQGLLRSAAGTAAPLLGALAPALDDLLGGTHLGDTHLGGGERPEHFTVAVVDFLRALAGAAGGLLLHLDDVQWIDAVTSRIVARLMAAGPDAPLLVVCTARDDEAGLAATDAFCASLGAALDLDITLGPLDERGVADLVAAQLPGVSARSALPRLLAVRSAGNPFVALEYLRVIVDAGLLRPCWGTWVLDAEGLGALELPQDVLGLVIARVDALGADSRRLLAAAAGVGTRFHPTVLARVCDADLDLVLAAVAEAAEHRLVERGGDGDVVFLHDQIREALLHDLDQRQRRVLHRRIADALAEQADPRPRAAYERAHHWLLAEQAGAQPQVFAACLAAGRLALADHAPAAAVLFLRHAAGTGTALDARFLRLFGEALFRDGRYAEAQEQLERALRAETAPIERAEILYHLGGVHRTTWNAPAALDAASQGLAELRASVPRHQLLALASTLGHFAAGLIGTMTGIGAGTARGEQARRHELTVALHILAGYVGIETMQPSVLVNHYPRTMYPLHRLGPGPTYAYGHAGLGFCAATFRLWGAAKRSFRRAEAETGRLGDPEPMATIRWCRGAATYMVGRDDGDSWAQVMAEHGRWLDSGLQDDGYTSLAWDAVVAGRTREAAGWYERGTQRRGSDGEISSMITVGAVIDAAAGRAAAAGATLRRVRPMLTEHGSIGRHVNFLLAELYACVEQEDFTESFDRVAQEVLGLGLRPWLMIRQHRMFWVHYALGRIAQCRLPADDRQRRKHRAAAGQALRQLRRVADTQFVRCAARLARAQLLLVDGRPQRCLKMLATMPALKPDAPMLAYEAARTRARALRVLGHEAEATRQAAYAQHVALAEGWPHRVRWVCGEFDLPAVGVVQRAPWAHDSTAGTRPDHHRLRALAAVSKAAMRVVDPEALARIALDETIRVLAAERALLFLTVADPAGGQADPAHQLVPHVGRDAAGNDVEEFTGYTRSLVERVAATGEPIVVTGTEEGAALGAQSAVVHGLRSILVAPLQLDSRVLGVVYLDSQVAKGIFTAEDADILTAITEHVAMSLETARAAQLEVSVEKARQQRDLAEMLHDALTRMSALLDPDEVLACLLEQAVRIAPGQDACLLTPAPAGIAMRLAPHGQLARRERLLAAQPAIRRLTSLTTATTARGSELPAAIGEHLGSVKSWLALPLATRDATLGVLVLTSTASDAYQDAEVNVAAALVAQGMAAYNNAALFARVQVLAGTDGLTGLANRRQFFETAEQTLVEARRHSGPVTAAMIDIDHFKRVNDAYGHLTGDDVIRSVATRLADGIRTTDILGRYGGEEFAILLPGTDLDAGTGLAERLRGAMAEQPVPTRSGLLPVTVSIGVAALTPADGGLDTLLARADQCLYRAKQTGRDQVRTG